MKLLAVDSKEDGSVRGLLSKLALNRPDIQVKQYPYFELKRSHGSEMTIAGISHSILQDQSDVVLFFANEDWYPGLIAQFTCMDIKTILVEEIGDPPCSSFEASVLMTEKKYAENEIEMLMGSHAERFTDPVFGLRTMSIEVLDMENLHEMVSDEVLDNCESMNFHEISDNFSKIATKKLNHDFEDLWYDNLESNLPHIVNSVKKLKDAHKGKTGYVFSNGPSLKKFLELDKLDRYRFGAVPIAFEDDDVVVTVNGAYRELRNAGRNIDYLHIVHPEDNQYQRQIEGVQENNTTKLLVSSTIHPSTYAGWDESLLYWYHAYNNDELLESYKGLDLPMLSGGVSIGPLACGFLLHAGCNRIVFIGQDFSYTRLEKYNGVPLKPSDVLSGPTYVTEDLNGNMTLTNKTLERSRDAIAQLSVLYDGTNCKRHVEFVNASEEGTLFGGNILQEKLTNIF